MRALEVARQFRAFDAATLGPVPAGGQSIADCDRLLHQLAQLPTKLHDTVLARRLRESLEFVRRKESADSLDAATCGISKTLTRFGCSLRTTRPHHHLGDPDSRSVGHGHRHHDGRRQFEPPNAGRIDGQSHRRPGRGLRPYGGSPGAHDGLDVHQVLGRASGRSALAAVDHARRKNWSAASRSRRRQRSERGRDPPDVRTGDRTVSH